MRTALDRAVEEAAYLYGLQGKIHYEQTSRMLHLNMKHGKYYSPFPEYTEKRVILGFIARCIKREADIQKRLDDKERNDLQDSLL